MGNFFRTFFAELKRNIFSAKFPAMALLITAAYLAGSIEEIKFMWNSKTADIIYLFDLTHNIGSFTNICVLCCTALNSIGFLRDHKTGFLRHCVLRNGKRAYFSAKYSACALSGGLILAVGQTLFILLLSIRFPLFSPDGSAKEQYSMIRNIFTSELVLSENIIGFFAVYVLFAFLYGAMWSGLGLMISTFIDDYYAASFSPYILSFVINRLLVGTGFFRPDAIFHANFDLGGVPKSILGAVGYLSALTAVFGIVFYIKSKRRCAE